MDINEKIMKQLLETFHQELDEELQSMTDCLLWVALGMVPSIVLEVQKMLRSKTVTASS